MLTGIEKVLFLLLAAGSLYYASVGFMTFTERLLAANLILVWTISGSEFCGALDRLYPATVFKTRPLFSFLHALIFRLCILFSGQPVDVLEFVSFHARGGFGRPFNIGGPTTASVLIGMIGLVIRRFCVRPKDFAFPSNVPLQPEVVPGSCDSTIVASFILFHVGSRACSRQPNWLARAPTLSIR